eukprot:gene10839-14550_t
MNSSTAINALDDDPRREVKSNKSKRNGDIVIKKKGTGRNTESFDPKSTLIRPEMRILIGNLPTVKNPNYNGVIRHDDVIVVPNFFCETNDWNIYYKLVEEMRESQRDGLKGSEWISWHEGAHLISQNPSGSPLFNEIQSRISQYFNIANKSVGTRFNWYKDSADWKPFHHDSAAFNPQRARNQNITVGVSFGATRELAFLNAANGTKIYFPQTNGMLFSFGRDVNINWKHGINALPDEQQDGHGRVSIILWGLCPNVVEEPNSPPMLCDNTHGNGHNIHANNHNNHNKYNKEKPFLSKLNHEQTRDIEKYEKEDLNYSNNDKNYDKNYNNNNNDNNEMQSKFESIKINYNNINTGQIGLEVVKPDETALNNINNDKKHQIKNVDESTTNDMKYNQKRISQSAIVGLSNILTNNNYNHKNNNSITINNNNVVQNNVKNEQQKSTKSQLLHDTHNEISKENHMNTITGSLKGVTKPVENNNTNNNRPICRNFSKTGNCQFGLNCKFSHQIIINNE